MVTDAERRDLYAALDEQLGRGPADTMMELLPPVQWDDIARRSDIAELRAELKGDIAEVRSEFSKLRSELKGDMAELRGEFSELRGEYRSQLPKLYTANTVLAVSVAGLVLMAAKFA